MNDAEDVLVSIPLNDLVQALNAVRGYSALAYNVEELRRQLDGLRSLYLELLDELKELRRSLS